MPIIVAEMATEEFVEALQTKRPDLVCFSWYDTDKDQLVAAMPSLCIKTASLKQFTPSGDGCAPDFTKFQIIDYGNTLKFGDYEAAVDSIEWD